MADLKDLLNSKKLKEFKAKKRRPWDPDVPISKTTVEHNSVDTKTIDIEQNSLNASNTSNITSSPTPISNPELSGEKPVAARLSRPKIRNQNGINTESDDYVNKNDYVISTETEGNHELHRESLKISNGARLRNQNAINTESDDYVNKNDYVISKETKPRLDHFQRNREKDTEVTSRFSEERNLDYVIKAQAERKQNVNTESNSTDYVINTDTGTKSNTESERKQESIYKLSRLESQILSYIMRLCMANRSKKTPPVSYDQIAVAAITTAKTAKTLTARLIVKGFLVRDSFTKGPGSRTVFVVPDDSYQAFLIKSHAIIDFDIRNQSAINTESHTATIAESKVSSSSNNILINNTTTERVEQWHHIKIPKVLADCGFTNTHAKQVLSDKENKLTFEEVQESFDNFAFDVEKNKITVRTNHVSYLMSVLRSQRIAYVSLYQKEQERLQLEDYLKELKKEEELKKMKLQMELSQKFAEWLKSKSQAEKNQIVPPTGVVSEGSQIQENLLKAYFCKENGISID